jgi:hypothetical protein
MASIMTLVYDSIESDNRDVNTNGIDNDIGL